MKCLHYLLLTVFWFFQVAAVAQTPIPINQVQFQIISPSHLQQFKGTLSNLREIGDQLEVRIFQPSSVAFQKIRLEGVLKSMDGSIQISSRTGANIIELNGTQPFTLRGSDLGGFFSDVQTEGIDKGDLLAGGFVPEGMYRLCLIAYDADFQDGFSKQISLPDLSGCLTFTAQYPEPPQLQTIGGNPVFNGIEGLIVPASQAPFLISWSPTTSTSIPAQYTVRITDMGLEVDPNVALSQRRQPFYEQSVFITNVLVGKGGLMNIEFEVGHHYAIEVEAKVLFGPTIKNDGKSTAREFWYGNQDGVDVQDGISVRSYPSGGHMPFRGMPVIVHYEPYDEMYRRYKYAFELRGGYKDGSTVHINHNRQLQWPDGPLKAQIIATGNEGMKPEQAQFIAISPSTGDLRESQKPEDFNVYYDRGGSYFWNAGISITKELANQKTTEVDLDLKGDFIAGMGMPVLQKPENNSRLEKGEVTIVYRSSDEPDVPFNIPFDIVQASKGTIRNYNITLLEKAILEVSTDSTFSIADSIVHTSPMKLEQNPVNSDWNSLKGYIYKEVSNTITLAKDGTYFWRVKWLRNPDNETDTASYSRSKIWHFTIGEEKPAEIADGDLPESDENCGIACQDLPLPESTATAPLQNKSKVVVGNFHLHISKITGGSADGYKGEGIVTNFGLWGYKRLLSVTFDGLKATQVVKDGRKFMQAIGGELLTVSSGTEFTNIIQSVTGYPLSFPLGLDAEIDGGNLKLQLDQIKFTPQKAEAVARVEVHLAPGDDGVQREFNFKAHNVCMIPAGFGNKARFSLENDIPINSETASYQMYFKGIGEGDADLATFVDIKCDTLSIQLAGGVRFARSKLIPENDEGDIIEGDEVVRGEFRIRYDRFAHEMKSGVTKKENDWIGALTFNHPFQIAGHEGWGFKVVDAVFDYSKMTNAADMNFPELYKYTWLPEEEQDNEQLRSNWTGVYIKSLNFRAPKNFSEERISFGVNDFIYDETGLTFSISGENILPTNKAGWDFTIDHLNMSLVQSSTFTGEMNGTILLPNFDKGSELKYNMLFASNGTDAGEEKEEGKEPNNPNFIATVSIPGEEPLNMSLLFAKVRLEPNSTVEFNIGGKNKFQIKGVLNGTIGLDPEKLQKEVLGMEMKDLRFNNLRFDTDSSGFFVIEKDKKPVFSFASPQHSVGNMPVTISGIEFRKHKELIDNEEKTIQGLYFKAKLSLSDKFSADLGLGIYGRLKVDGVKTVDVGFARIALDAITIDVDYDGFKLKGQIEYYKEHETYGNGFYGNVAVTMPMQLGGRLTARFGSMGKPTDADYYRYWFVDGMVHLPTPIYIGALAIHSLGGGAYHHMRINNSGTTASLSASQLARKGFEEGKSQNPNDSNANTANALNDLPGSGLEFVPDKAVYLGIRVGVVGSVGSKDVFNMDVALTAEITSSGGLGVINVKGDGYLLKKMKGKEQATEDDKDTPVTASVDITYNNSAKILTGNFKVFVSFKEFISGGLTDVSSGKENLAGEAQLYVSSDKWYFKLGSFEEEKRSKLKITLGIKDVNATVAMNAYFMMGHEVPAYLPPLPSFISNLLTGGKSVDNDIKETGRENKFTDQSLYQEGRGIAFGSTALLVADLDFLIFYASLNVGIGFDVNLTKSYGDVLCNGSTDPRGVNGWYAQGQAFAGLQGMFGIEIDLRFFKGRYKIAEIGAAVAMKAALPNPNYFQGRAALSYSILNGLVDGYCNFNIELGSKCVMGDGGILSDLQFVSDMQPGDLEKGVTPGVKIATSFNFAMDKVLKVEEVKGNTVKVHRFRPYIYAYTLKRKSNAAWVTISETTKEYNEAKTLNKLIPNQYLNPQTQHQASIVIRVKELTDRDTDISSTDEKDLVLMNNVVFSEERSITFTTGDMPTVIDQQVESWPIISQKYFLQNAGLEGVDPLHTFKGEGENLYNTFESRGKKGYVKVGAQQYLFTNTSNGQNAANSGGITGRKVSYKAWFVPVAGVDSIGTDLLYDPLINALEFDIPTLANSSGYMLKVVRNLESVSSATLSSNLKVEQRGQTTTLQAKDRSGNIVQMEGGASSQTINRNQISGTQGATPLVRQFVVHQYAFKTSRFNSITEKLAGATLVSNGRSATGEIKWKLSTQEPFEAGDFAKTIEDPGNTKAIGMAQLPLMSLSLPASEFTSLTNHPKFRGFQDFINKYRVFQDGFKYQSHLCPTEYCMKNFRFNGPNFKHIAAVGNGWHEFLAYAPSVAAVEPRYPNSQPYYLTSYSVPQTTVATGSAGGSMPGNDPRVSGSNTSQPQAGTTIFQDLTDAIITTKHQQMITNLTGLKTKINEIKSAYASYGEDMYKVFEGQSVEYGWPLYLDYLTELIGVDTSYRHQAGSQLFRVTFWVPTMKGPYPTKPIDLAGAKTAETIYSTPVSSPPKSGDR